MSDLGSQPAKRASACSRRRAKRAYGWRGKEPAAREAGGGSDTAAAPIRGLRAFWAWTVRRFAALTCGYMPPLLRSSTEKDAFPG